MDKIVFRKMTENDIEAVSQIDEKSFPKPWPKQIYYEEMNLNQYAKYFVTTVNEEVVGFCGTWMVLDEAQVTNIAIHPAYRGRGLGEGLFQYVINYAVAHDVKHLSLEVRMSNLVAQRMYKKFGLQPGGVRKNYYTDNQEDALVLWVNL
ncbi:ribosomal protein S18-alanine N-acetyltransferase [Gracilibacillus sp. YIM 98692]|uniref:ribosomal protein S18-alanine N-acetyltransferase n=1 Tax=Gracilibacillus sp. YIM 98692 TaxID=2663532 RepID=UPI0013D07B9D|nr:ribosomal protein S18-alanine N-acetyltransferase [Gracilibacillus sp. YIM 98692]